MAKSVLEIVFRTLKEGTGDADAKRSLADLQKGAKETLANFAILSAGAMVVGKALNFSADEAMEAEKMQAKLAAVLKSTGGAAGMTQNSLNALADSLSNMSSIDDELIVNSEAVMLTFTQIGKQVFPEAMTAALNMNAVLGGDLQQSVVQLGKALNVTAGDTTAASMGLTAMRRSGVSFTEEQKEMAMQMVKTGDVIGYQKLILAELNTEFGGAAEAMGRTAAGSAEKLKNSLGNLGAAFGERLLPAITETNNALSRTVDAMTDAVELSNLHNAAEEQLAESMGMTNEEFDIRHRYDQRFREDVAAGVDEIIRWTQYGQAWEQQLSTTTQELIEQEAAIKAVSDANQSQLSTIMQMQSEYESFTEKNESLRLKLEELTAQQERYTEGSSKFNDIQTEIDETKTAIDQLADEHEMAGKRIAFSLLQAKMASDGLSDAEMVNLVLIGERWGILDKDVAVATLNMMGSADKMAQSLEDPRDTVMSLNDKVRALKSLTGSSFDFYVNIHTSGSMPYLPSKPDKVATPGAPAVAMAGGGQLGSGWAMVGEEGFELVTPSGYVIPNDISRELLRGGVSPEFAFRIGGDLAGTGVFAGGGGYTPETRAMVQKKKTSGGSTSLPAAVVKSEVAQASSAAIAPMAEVTAAAVQTSASVQQASAMQTQALMSAVTVSTESMASEQRETNRLLAEQSKTLARDLVAAMMQANP